MVGKPFTEEPYGIGIPKQNEDMVRFVNGVLEKSVRDGQWLASYNEYLARPGEVGIPPSPEYR
jgi:polar amino acid transport system substrate-binding protein